MRSQDLGWFAIGLQIGKTAASWDMLAQPNPLKTNKAED
jgi:hypothetical protein